MEEIVLRWIERVGFPIFVACLAMYGCYRLFGMFLASRDTLQQSMEDHAEKVSRISHDSNKALALNTLATQELSDTLKKKLGSDPDSLCRAAQVFAEFEKIVKTTLSADEQQIILKHRAEVSAKKVLDDAELAKVQLAAEGAKRLAEDTAAAERRHHLAQAAQIELNKIQLDELKAQVQGS